MGPRRRIVTLAVLLTLVGALAPWPARRRSSRATCGSTSTPTSRRRPLPRERPAPITIEVGGKISTTDGSHPPALRQLRIELNSAGRIDTRGLPACAASALQSTSSERGARPLPPGAGRRRAPSKRSSGRAAVLVNGRALVFNGRVRGRAGMLIHIYISRRCR